MLGFSSILKGERLAAEVEEGNREYKFKLTNLTKDQLKHRVTQMNWRLNEGNGEAFYLIGVEDDGNQLGISEKEMQESLKNLRYMASQVNSDMSVVQLYTGQQGITAEACIRRRQRETVSISQMSVAFAGSENDGKSSLISVLSTGLLDNGHGSARSRILTHSHEMASGRTSTVSHHTLHFDRNGDILNAAQRDSSVEVGAKCTIKATTTASSTFSSNISTATESTSTSSTIEVNSKLKQGIGHSTSTGNGRFRALSDIELLDAAYRMVTLIDLAGHTKYLKTTLHGLVGFNPDICIVCISASAGLRPGTAELIETCLLLQLPIMIVITKVDTVATTADGGGSTTSAAVDQHLHQEQQWFSSDDDDEDLSDNVDDEQQSNSISAAPFLTDSEVPSSITVGRVGETKGGMGHEALKQQHKKNRRTKPSRNKILVSSAPKLVSVLTALRELFERCAHSHALLAAASAATASSSSSSTTSTSSTSTDDAAAANKQTHIKRSRKVLRVIEKPSEFVQCMLSAASTSSSSSLREEQLEMLYYSLDGCSNSNSTTHRATKDTAVNRVNQATASFVPVFLVSSKTGYGMDTLQQCLFQLPSRIVRQALQTVAAAADNHHGNATGIGTGNYTPTPRERRKQDESAINPEDANGKTGMLCGFSSGRSSSVLPPVLTVPPPPPPMMRRESSGADSAASNISSDDKKTMTLDGALGAEVRILASLGCIGLQLQQEDHHHQQQQQQQLSPSSANGGNESKQSKIKPQVSSSSNISKTMLLAELNGVDEFNALPIATRDNLRKVQEKQQDKDKRGKAKKEGVSVQTAEQKAKYKKKASRKANIYNIIQEEETNTGTYHAAGATAAVAAAGAAFSSPSPFSAAQAFTEDSTEFSEEAFVGDGAGRRIAVNEEEEEEPVWFGTGPGAGRRHGGKGGKDRAGAAGEQSTVRNKTKGSYGRGPHRHSSSSSSSKSDKKSNCFADLNTVTSTSAIDGAVVCGSGEPLFEACAMADKGTPVARAPIIYRSSPSAALLNGQDNGTNSCTDSPLSIPDKITHYASTSAAVAATTSTATRQPIEDSVTFLYDDVEVEKILNTYQSPENRRTIISTENKNRASPSLPVGGISTISSPRHLDKSVGGNNNSSTDGIASELVRNDVERSNYEALVAEFGMGIVAAPIPISTAAEEEPSTSTLNTCSNSSSNSSSGAGRGGLVLIGNVRRGVLLQRARVMLGPTADGSFLPTQVMSLRLNGVPVLYATRGQTVSFTLGPVIESIEATSTGVTSAKTEYPPHPAYQGMEEENIVQGSKNSHNSNSSSNNSNSNSNNKRRSSVRGLVLLPPGEICRSVSSSSSNSGNSGTSNNLSISRHGDSGGGDGGCIRGAPCWGFEALIRVMDYSKEHCSSTAVKAQPSGTAQIGTTTSSRRLLRVDYQPVAHIDSVCQTVRLVSMRRLPVFDNTAEGISEHNNVDRNNINSSKSSSSQQQQQQTQTQAGCEIEEAGAGEVVACTFMFRHFPEYLVVGSSVVIRDSQIKGAGTVAKLITERPQVTATATVAVVAASAVAIKTQPIETTAVQCT